MSLTINTFYIKEVAFEEKNNVNVEGSMTLNKEALQGILLKEPLIKKIDLQIIISGDHDRWTNCIMDFIPISTKVLGTIGNGITHTLNGVYVMLTGVDSDGQKLTRAGITDGILKDLVCKIRVEPQGKMTSLFLLMWYWLQKLFIQGLDLLQPIEPVTSIFKYSGKR